MQKHSPACRYNCWHTVSQCMWRELTKGLTGGKTKHQTYISYMEDALRIETFSKNKEHWPLKPYNTHRSWMRVSNSDHIIPIPEIKGIIQQLSQLQNYKYRPPSKQPSRNQPFLKLPLQYINAIYSWITILKHYLFLSKFLEKKKFNYYVYQMIINRCAPLNASRLPNHSGGCHK